MCQLHAVLGCRHTNNPSLHSAVECFSRNTGSINFLHRNFPLFQNSDRSGSALQRQQNLSPLLLHSRDHRHLKGFTFPFPGVWHLPGALSGGMFHQHRGCPCQTWPSGQCSELLWAVPPPPLCRGLSQPWGNGGCLLLPPLTSPSPSLPLHQQYSPLGHFHDPSQQDHPEQTWGYSGDVPHLLLLDTS